MSTIGEAILYSAAKRLYRTEIAQTQEMKDSLSDIDSYDQFRSGEAEKVMAALARYGIDLRNKRVIDFGCNDGALSERYRRAGAMVTGVDIDAEAITRAKQLHPDIAFCLSGVDGIPLPDASADVIVSFDVFEHVAQPESILREMRRILAPGGRVVIGTIGWWSPFAPHLWSTMPVPWAHVLFRERTVLRACRRVYHSPWYRPTMHDLDAEGKRLPDKYTADEIPREYLNHYLLRDFERAFRDACFDSSTYAVPIHNLRPLRPLCRLPWFRELLSASVWFVLTAA